MENIVKNKTKKYFLIGIIALLMVLLIAPKLLADDRYATVVLDVNPSIELELSDRETVAELIGLNEEGKVIVAASKPSDKSVKETLNALLETLIAQDYLKEEDNVLLLSVDAKKKDSEALKDNLNETIAVYLSQAQIKATIITQSFKAEQYRHANAKGKAALIDKLTLQDQSLSKEALQDKSIKELMVVTENQAVKLSDVRYRETAQQAKIGKEAAITKALAFHHLNKEDVIDLEGDLEREDGIFVWEIEFIHKNYKYETIVHAQNGEILASKRHTLPNNGNNEAKEELIPTASQKAAIAKALAYHHLQENEVTRLDIERERKGNILVWEVEFTAQGYKYETFIAIKTGEILHATKEAFKSTANPDPQEEIVLPSEKKAIAKAEAIKIALKDFGKSAKEVGFIETEIDFIRGHSVYAVEFDFAGYEYEYAIDLYTGKIIAKERERD